MHCLREIAQSLSNPFYGYDYLSIQAERDLKREDVSFKAGIIPMDKTGHIVDVDKVHPDGAGLTRLIVKCLHEESGHAAGRMQLVEKELLSKINSVLSPDLTFKRIFSKADSDGESWEIYLEEEQKGGLKLSDCGSGIKTVIFVMMMLYVVPKLLRKTLGEAELRRVFQQHNRGLVGHLSANYNSDHWNGVGARLVGKEFELQTTGGSTIAATPTLKYYVHTMTGKHHL